MLAIAACIGFGGLVGTASAQYSQTPSKTSPGVKDNSRPSVVKGSDNSGRIVYSDRPITGVDPKATLKDRKFTDYNPDSVLDHREEVKIIKSKEFARIQEQKIEEARLREQNSEANRARQICENSRMTLANIAQGTGTTIIDDKGHTVKKTPQRIAAEREYAIRMVREHCNPPESVKEDKTPSK